MAHESRNGGDIPGVCAGEDLTKKEHHLCVFDANGEAIVQTTVGGRVDGVVTNKPAQGEAVSLFNTNAIMKVVAGAAIAGGDEISCDANGQAKVAAAGEFVVGVCREAAAQAGELCSVFFNGGYIKA